MNGSDRDISQWDARLKEQLERSFHNYHKRRIDLSIARVNEKLNWTGETIIVEKASSSDASATVRILFDDADPLELKENVVINSIFNRVYLSNTAQAGEWLDVIYGINFEYKKKVNGGGLIGNTFVDVYRSVPQVILPNTMTQVNFDTQISDRNNEFDFVTDLFTAKNDGDYLVIVHAKIDVINNKAGYYPFLNGVAQQAINFVAPALEPESLGGVGTLFMPLSQGDTVYFNVWHNCVGNKNLLGGIANNRLQIYRLK